MKKKFVSLLFILITLILTACIPADYSGETKKQYISKGKLLIDEYLNSNFSGYSLGEIKVDEGMRVDDEIYGGYTRSLTNLVYGDFTYENESYRIYANIETGEIYTGAYSFDLEKAAQNCLVEVFERNGIEADIFVLQVSSNTSVVSKGIPTKEGETITTQTTIYNVLPADLNESNIEDFIKASLGKENNYTLSLSLFTSSENETLSKALLEKTASDCPGLSSLTILVTDQKSLKQSILNNSADPEMYINLSEEISLDSQGYEYITYEPVDYKDIHIIAPSSVYCKSAEGEIYEAKAETTFTEDDNRIVIETKNSTATNYILFGGDKNYNSSTIKLANTMLSEDPDPSEYEYRPYGNYFYTIAGLGNYSPYYFRNKIIIAK